jgi:hypothetical protein
MDGLGARKNGYLRVGFHCSVRMKLFISWVMFMACLQLAGNKVMRFLVEDVT